MTATLNAIEWAKLNGIEFGFEALLDNHEPPRARIYGGRGWWYTHPEPHVGQGVILETELFRDGHSCGYLIEVGDQVEAYYVTGWHADHGYLILHKFPALRDESNGWMIGPRRYYHLLVVN